jgi:hypothetical protein
VRQRPVSTPAAFGHPLAFVISHGGDGKRPDRN